MQPLSVTINPPKNSTFEPIRFFMDSVSVEFLGLWLSRMADIENEEYPWEGDNPASSWVIQKISALASEEYGHICEHGLQEGITISQAIRRSLYHQAIDFFEHQMDISIENPGDATLQADYQMLGLSPGATEDEVISHSRTLIKKLHPDISGTSVTSGLMNKVKEARDRIISCYLVS